MREVASSLACTGVSGFDSAKDLIKNAFKLHRKGKRHNTDQLIISLLFWENRRS